MRSNREGDTCSFRETDSSRQADGGKSARQIEEIRFGSPSLVVLAVIFCGVGERVLGSFNVGSDQAQAYTADQINQLEQITSQVAITIENLNLAEQTQRTLAELDAANRQLVGQVWEQHTHASKLEAAEWRNGIWSVLNQRAAQRTASQALVPAAPPLTLPIRVRGTTIGEFNIAAADAQQVWDNEEITFAQSLIDQVGQVLETARLLDESERTAQREKAVADAADKFHRSTDIEAVRSRGSPNFNAWVLH